MANKQDALVEIVGLARAHGLSADEIRDAMETELQTGPDKGGVLGRIFAILGGIFVFSGIAVFASMNWDVMNSAARIIITLGSGIAAFVLALIASGDTRYQKAVAPLLLIAAVMQPTGLLVTINEYFSGGNWRHAALLVAGAMLLQQGLVFYSRKYATLLFTSILFALWFLTVGLDLLNMDAKHISMLLGISTVGLCVGLSSTAYRAVTPFFFLIGALAFYSGLFATVEGEALELIFLFAACGGVFLSATVRSRTLLIVSTIAILSYIGYFTGKHFADSLGWPIVLVLLGIALIVMSALAMRINRRYIK